MQASAPYSVGLAGDGDEVAAIEEVERVFGVTLDTRNAATWRTAGDVLQALREAGAYDADWAHFAETLAAETGVDPALLSPSSPLLLPRPPWWHSLAILIVLAAVVAAAVWLIR